MALPTLPGASPHNNQQLFSDYYLDAVLPGLAGWDALAAEASRVRDALAAKFAAYTPSANEAQTEDEWVKPVLTAQKETHDARTAAIIAGETDLNARVGESFGLTDNERALIESSTKYAFGEV